MKFMFLNTRTLLQELDNARLCQTVARSRSFTPATHHGLSLNLSAPLSLSFHTTSQNCQSNSEEEDEENVGEERKVGPDRPRPKYGQFTVELVKVRGSLGFSLNKDDAREHSVLRHSVKALLREPALTDGRIRPGDKLISANGTSCDGFSHQELVSFLRGCPDAVSLVLYRDDSRAQTPASPAAEETRPSGSAFAAYYPRQKQLRHEAKEMVRSLQASRTSLDGSPGGSVASIGSGVLLRRGFSPHRRVRAMSGGDDGSTAPLSIFESSAPPTVEFPVSPTEEEYRSLPALVQERLQIEELTMSTMEED